MTDCLGTKCGDKTPVIGGLGVFPLQILKETYDFSAACSPAPAPSSGLTVGVDAGIAVGVMAAGGLGFYAYSKSKKTKEGALLGNEYSSMGGDRA
jgi:hypothetical protein